MNKQQRFLRATDVATELGVTTSRIYQLIQAGEIPSIRLGGAVRIPRDAWDAWLASQRDRALRSLATLPWD